MSLKEFKADYERETGQKLTKVVAEVLYDRYCDAQQYVEVMSPEEAQNLQREAELDAEERAYREANPYVACEHGLDSQLCGGPMHWYDETNGGAF